LVVRQPPQASDAFDPVRTWWPDGEALVRTGNLSAS
jgi:hypothetical protein